MRIHIGFEIVYDCVQTTPMMLAMNVHPSRAHDLQSPDPIRTEPSVAISTYRDRFDNICSRLVAPRGAFKVFNDAVVYDSGVPDEINLDAEQHLVQDLPDECLIYLLGSRYCETDHLSAQAWSLFGSTPPGWRRVAAICEYVHNQITFGYHFARPTKTASDALREGQGVCRDFAHSAVALCRCMNIPARYCTGYLGDIGVPIDPNPMDFSAWFEAYLGGRWYTFDARHNKPRIGRIVMARGRDATDVALSNTFGLNYLNSFKVWSDELKEMAAE